MKDDHNEPKTFTPVIKIWLKPSEDINDSIICRAALDPGKWILCNWALAQQFKKLFIWL